MENIINFFLKNKPQLEPYFDKIKVNQEKTLIKFGSIENQEITINFLINGELSSDINYEQKIKSLFNSNDDLSILNDIIQQIKHPFTVNISTQIKLSEDNAPLINAFRLTLINDAK